jgi:hypothetical protein
LPQIVSKAPGGSVQHILFHAAKIRLFLIQNRHTLAARGKFTIRWRGDDENKIDNIALRSWLRVHDNSRAAGSAD